MCYVADMFFIYQCDRCPNVLRAAITPIHFCRFGHIYRPGPAQGAQAPVGEQPRRQQQRHQQQHQQQQDECPNGFNPVPESDVPPPTLTVKSNERCGDCQRRIDLFPDEDREMERLLLWNRWLTYIVASELGGYLSVRSEYERSQ